MSEGDPIHALVRLLTRLPGVGEKSARRIAYHVLGADPEYARALGETIATMSDRVRRCASCGAYTSRVRCSICDDPRRTTELLCVVARPMDADAVERARVFQGRYHILHALLDPLGGVGPAEFPLEALLERVEREGVREVILATPPTVDTSLLIFFGGGGGDESVCVCGLFSLRVCVCACVVGEEGDCVVCFRACVCVRAL